MGARAEQQLALGFLDAVHALWIQYPGSYVVEESNSDLVAALAQMCIKALAADIRDGSSLSDQQRIIIQGQLLDGTTPRRGDGTNDPLTLRDVVNKIIHGSPTLIIVHDDRVELHFKNNKVAENWTEARFSGTQLINVLGAELVKHPRTTDRGREVRRFLDDLGKKRFLPSELK